MSKIPIITIDGPSGVGKGTISQMLSLDLSWNILDSGALYRTLTYLMKLKTLQLKEFNKNREKILREFKVSFKATTAGEPVNIFLNHENITERIRTEEIARETSELASSKEIRDFIRPIQREFKRLPGLIADGRDMGTVIFPEADIKFFLTANVEERAKRRQLQLKRDHLEVNMRVLLKELEERDKKDKEREHSPLIPADDSILIDTSYLDQHQVLEEVKKEFLKVLKII